MMSVMAESPGQMNFALNFLGNMIICEFFWQAGEGKIVHSHDLVCFNRNLSCGWFTTLKQLQTDKKNF